MNQQGSVSYLVLVPSLVTVLVLAASIILLVSAIRKDQKACRRISLDIQTIQGEALNKILTLNTTAKALRQNELVIKTAIVAAAATPGAQGTLGNLYAALRVVQSSQKTLGFQQKSIISTANIKATQIASSSNKLPQKSIRLRIHAINKNETAPEYEVDLNFEKAQSVNYRYKIIIKDILPGWLFKFFLETRNLEMECGSTLKKKENKWIPVLSAAS